MSLPLSTAKKFLGRFLCTLIFAGVSVTTVVVHAQFENASEGNVTIPMSSYQDLLDRVTSIESQVQATETVVSQNLAGQASNLSNGTDQIGGGLYLNYELVFLRPIYSNNTAFYEHDNIAGVSEGAILREFDWELDDSHRLELGYLNSSSNLGWRTRFWFFDTDAMRVSPSNVDVKVGVADDPDIALDTISATDNDFLVATAGTDIEVVDLEGFTKRWRYDSLFTFSGGVRYARIEHQYVGLDVDPGVGTQNLLITDHNFNGAGPTLSFNVRKQLPNSCFDIDIGGRGSMLFGSGDGRWDRISVGGFTDAILHEGQMRIVPVAELNMGVIYRRPVGFGCMELGTGVETQVWFNGGTPLNAGQDGATDSDRISSPWSQDLAFLGGYFRATVRY